MKPTSQLLSTSDAAHHLGLSIDTLKRWRKIKTGPRFVRIGKKTVRYKLDELETFLRSKTEVTSGK